MLRRSSVPRRLLSVPGVPMAQSTAVELLREAMAAVRGNDPARTRELLRQATKLEPTNETAWAWLAGAAESPADALAAYERVLTLNPVNEKAKAAVRPVRLQVGIAAARAKDLPTARRLLRLVVADDPNAEQGWVWLAGVSESMTDAIAHLRRALAINPNNTAAKKGLDYYNAKLRAASNGEAGPPSESVPGVVRPSGPFTTLPQPSGRMPLPGPTIQTPPPGAGRPAGRTPTVLVVEPSRTLRKIIGLTLADDGLTMSEAEDGLDAVERIKADGPPAVIVTAAELPGIDGYELCKLIRQHPETAPVPLVVLTPRDGLKDRVRVRRAGADAHLPMPLRPAALKAVVAGFRQPEPAAP